LFSRRIQDKLSVKEEVTSDVIVVGIQTPASPGKQKEKQNLLYPTDASSISIATDSSTFVGLTLEPMELETYEKKIERGRVHGKTSIEFWGIKFSIERKPRKEVETITRTIWRKPQK